MRTLARSFALVALSAMPAAAEPASKNLLEPNYGLMVWTLVIFVVLAFILARFAFGPLTKAVEAREKPLEHAINAAQPDREEAAQVLADHRADWTSSRGELRKAISHDRHGG